MLLNPFITIIAGKYWDFYFFEVNMPAGIPFHKDHTQTCHHLSFIVFCALNLVQSLHILLRSRKAKTSSKKLKLLSLACLSTSSSEYHKLLSVFPPGGEATPCASSVRDSVFAAPGRHSPTHTKLQQFSTNKAE